MNTKFKNLTVVLLLLFVCKINAQELSSSQINAIKSDDTELFKQEFAKENYNQCFDIKESSYNILAIAIKMDMLKIFSYLLNNDEVDINKICDNKTPLMFAAKYGKEHLVKELIDKGADKNITNSKGYSAKNYAERENFPKIVELLR